MEWARVIELIGEVPERVFLPVGSGTLLRAFLRVLPTSVQVHAVDVNVLPPEDPRIASVMALPRVVYCRSELPFSTPSTGAPPFPSNPFYDAKLLPYVTAGSGGSTLWWNVAQ